MTARIKSPTLKLLNPSIDRRRPNLLFLHRSPFADDFLGHPQEGQRPLHGLIVNHINREALMLGHQINRG